MVATHEILSAAPALMSCGDARRLLQRMAVDDPTITGAEADALALHVSLCGNCQKAFYECVGMNQDGSFTAADAAYHSQIEPLLISAEEGWRGVLQRCPDLAVAQRREMRRQRARWIRRRVGELATIAACLAFALASGWWLRGRFNLPAPVVMQDVAEHTGNVIRGVGRPGAQAHDGLEALKCDLWPLSAPDIDTLEYATWRDEHRQYALLSSLQLAQANDSAQPDWIELLMVGGDIWQFHYDPKLSPDQPLAKLEPTAIARLARHYRVDERADVPRCGSAGFYSCSHVPHTGCNARPAVCPSSTAVA